MHENIVQHKQEFTKYDVFPLEGNKSMPWLSDFHEDLVVPKVVEGFPAESN